MLKNKFLKNRFKLVSWVLLIFIIFNISIFGFVTAESCLSTNSDLITIVNITNTNNFNLEVTSDPSDPYIESITITSNCDFDSNHYLFLQNDWYWKMQGSTKDLSFNIVDNYDEDVNNVFLDLKGHNIIVNVNNDEFTSKFFSTFSSNIPYIINTEGNSIIKIYENEERPVSDNKKGPFGVKLDLQNIDVNTGASLDILVKASDGEDHDEEAVNGSGPVDFDLSNIIDFDSDFDDIKNLISQKRSDEYDKDGDGIHGGRAILDIDSIINSGSLKIDMNSGSGGKGNKGPYKRDRKGGLGGTGGDIIFEILEINNYGTFDLNLNSGFGGDGGKGSNEGKFPNCKNDPKSGGSGGFGGFIFFDINSINNFGTSNFNLKAGDGGVAGNAGKNRCLSDNANGGHGGAGGFILFNDINNIANSVDEFNFNIIAGNGSDGGKKTKSGSYGTGGDGGFIFPLNINDFINISDFYYNSLSGTFGSKYKKGNSYSEKNGVAGSIGDLNIYYLDNKSQNLEIINRVNQSDSYFLKLLTNDNSNLPTVGSVDIGYLSSGSYLPKTISLLDTLNTPKWIYNSSSAPSVSINACYIKSSSSSLKYDTYVLDLASSNFNHYSNDFDNDSSNISILQQSQNFCPYCDMLPLDSAQRMNNSYSVYSDVSGTIKAEDLNIYYADKDSLEKFKLPTRNEPYLIYNNREDIEGIIAEDDDFAGLYKYNINVDNLYSVVDKFSLNSGNGDKPYCPAQNYYIEGIITMDNGTTKDFNFMFVPLYALN